MWGLRAGERLGRGVVTEVGLLRQRGFGCVCVCARKEGTKGYSSLCARVDVWGQGKEKVGVQVPGMVAVLFANCASRALEQIATGSIGDRLPVTIRRKKRDLERVCPQACR